MSRKQMIAERRARRAEVRTKVTALRAQLRAAMAAKNARLREIRRTIRAERLAVRDRLRENRRRFLEELRAWEETQRREAREAWQRRRRKAREQAEGEIDRVRAEMAASREHAKEVHRIAREVEERAETHARNQHTDDGVRASIPPELIPLFERVRNAIHSGRKASRAEVFLRLAEQQPNEVFKIIEPHVDEMIRATILALARARREARSCARSHSPPTAPANGNGLTAGGPLPSEVERIRHLEAHPREAAKGAGLDTTGIAKAIREDIKVAVRSGELPRAKYSVTTEKYSMGSSIHVQTSGLPFRVLNPAAFRLDGDGKWMTFDREHFTSRFTPEAQAVERKLEAIVGAYHWDRSDPATDYYNERFHRDVRLAEDKAEWQRTINAKLAAEREEART